MFVALNAPHLHLRIVAVAQNASLSEVTEKKYGEKKILITMPREPSFPSMDKML